MKLPIPFLQAKKESSLHYIALLLNSEKATAIILEEAQGKIKIINSETQHFPTSIEDLALEELINFIDKAITKAVGVLPADIEIRKTVFGVKENWVEEESKKIKKDYLKKLKKVCDALGLSPIGFMVISEAISHLIQEEDGGPLSAIIAEIGKKIVTLTLFRGGKSIQTVEGHHEGGYPATIDRLLKHFTIEVLPARIILYDSDITEDLVQKFIGHQWSKSLPFLHMPQISVLPVGFDGRAVLFGAANQMGFEALDEYKSAIKTYESGVHHHKAHAEHHHDHKEEVSTKENIETNNSLIAEENFGFIINEDIAISIPHNEDASTEKKCEGDSENDIQGKGDNFTAENIRIGDIEQSEKHINKQEDINNEKEDSEKEPNKKISNLKNWFKSISFKDVLPKSNNIIVPIIGSAILLAVLIGGAYYLYTTKVSASIIVSLKPKKITQEKDITFAADATNDFAQGILGAKYVDRNLEGDMTIGASGKKDVGDRSKGTVTLYNNSIDGDINVSAGTKITSENGLSFTVDNEVSVASASGDAFSGTKPGTKDVNITASEIGPSYNLPSGTKFKVDSNNSLAARNDNALSGGSKKAVTVVSKDDLTKLKNQLIKNLTDKASEELQRQPENDSVIIPIVLSTSVKSTKFNQNPGDEAKTVKLTASVIFKGLSYRNTDIKDFAKEIIKEKYGSNMTFDENTIKISINDTKQKSENEITATSNVSASLLPKTDNKALAKEISGKSKNEADALISKLNQMDHYTINYRPNLAFISNLITRLPNNVTITFSSN